MRFFLRYSIFFCRTALLLSMVLYSTWAVMANAATTLPVPERLFLTDGYGEHAIGTFDAVLVDEVRAEPLTSDPDDKRHVMVQVWYPAVALEGVARAPYVLRPELFEGTSNVDLKAVLAAPQVLTNAVLEAPVARAEQPFPVLIYNHGGGFPYFTGTFWTEFFASHGYVVVSVNHAEASGQKRLPDGAAYNKDVKLPADPSDSLHLDDIRFVLNMLERWNTTPGHRLHAALDMERVGSAGWSMGGATSIQASRDEPRIKAASNMDGFMWHRDVYKTGTVRPTLLWGCGPAGTDWTGDEDMNADAAKFRAMIMEALSECMTMLSKTESDWYQVNGIAIHHGSFSDLPLFVQKSTQEEQAQELAKHRRVHRAIQDVNLEFFDRYLRGRTDTPILDRKAKPNGFDSFIMLRNVRK